MKTRVKPYWYEELTPEEQAEFDELERNSEGFLDEHVTEAIFFNSGPKPDPCRAGQLLPRSPVVERRPPPRPWRVTRTLIPADTTVGSVEELRARCGDVLAADLRTLASWDADDYGHTWVVSDSTFLIVSFATDEGGSAYVQFLSDPLHQVVLWEVSSVEYQPGLAALLDRDEEARLLASGFAKRKSPSNYIREVAIIDDEAARRVAWEALGIVFDILEYRGGRDLVLEVVGERIAPERLVHERLMPEDFAFLLERWGHSAKVLEPADEPPSIVVAGSAGDPFVVVPEGQRTQYGYYSQYTLRMRLPRDGATEASVQRWMADDRFVRGYTEADDVVLIVDVDLTWGVTEDALRTAVGRLVAAGVKFREPTWVSTVWTPAERSILEWFANEHGWEWTREKAALIVDQARFMGELPESPSTARGCRAAPIRLPVGR